MRQIVLDTETTGLEAERGHRIIELACVEMVNRRCTGRILHHYLDPERDIDVEAQKVHGISREQLTGKPRFAAIAGEFLEFISGGELVIHNAAFDIAFLDKEFGRLDPPLRVRTGEHCRVLDTLLLARELHPGQRNSLDALCKRYRVDNSGRDLHGALLDARLLADRVRCSWASSRRNQRARSCTTWRIRRVSCGCRLPLPRNWKPTRRCVP
jgi:DNA polymerase III subunit epsilon